MYSSTSKDNFKLFVEILWSLWKVRCSCIYEGREPEVHRVLSMALSYSQIRYFPQQPAYQPQELGELNGNINPELGQKEGLICYIDGSFSPPNEGGVAYIIFQDGVLIEYGLIYSQALSPLHTELQAMQIAVEAIKDKGGERATIFTGCLQLRNLLVYGKPPLDID
jgi:hypothetical protein